MADPKKVVVDGVDTPDSKAKARPSWSWLAVGLLISLGFAFLLFAAVPLPQREMATIQRMGLDLPSLDSGTD